MATITAKRLIVDLSDLPSVSIVGAENAENVARAFLDKFNTVFGVQHTLSEKTASVRNSYYFPLFEYDGSTSDTIFFYAQGSNSDNKFEIGLMLNDGNLFDYFFLPTMNTKTLQSQSSNVCCIFYSHFSSSLQIDCSRLPICLNFFPMPDKNGYFVSGLMDTQLSTRNDTVSYGIPLEGAYILKCHDLSGNTFSGVLYNYTYYSVNVYAPNHAKNNETVGYESSHQYIGYSPYVIAAKIWGDVFFDEYIASLNFYDAEDNDLRKFYYNISQHNKNKTPFIPIFKRDDKTYYTTLNSRLGNTNLTVLLCEGDNVTPKPPFPEPGSWKQLTTVASAPNETYSYFVASNGDEIHHLCTSNSGYSSYTYSYYVYSSSGWRTESTVTFGRSNYVKTTAFFNNELYVAYTVPGKLMLSKINDLSNSVTVHNSLLNCEMVEYKNELHIIGYNGSGSVKTYHYKYDGTTVSLVASGFPDNVNINSAFTGITVHDGCIYVTTMTQICKYDGDSWSLFSNTPTEASIISPRNSLLSFNGYIHYFYTDDRSYSPKYMNHYAYDDENEEWTLLLDTPDVRPCAESGSIYTFIFNNKITALVMNMSTYMFDYDYLDEIT